MADYKNGGVPTPDYDSDVNYVSEKTEFTNDVFVYQKYRLKSLKTYSYMVILMHNLLTE